MDFALIALLLLAVAWAVSAPLRRPAPGTEGPDAGVRADLQAAREAKYREIRDAELDLRTGKLSPEDHRALDSELRAEAIEILRRLDTLGPDSRVDETAGQQRGRG